MRLIWVLTIRGITNHVFNPDLLFVLHGIKSMGFIILCLFCTGLMGEDGINFLTIQLSLKILNAINTITHPPFTLAISHSFIKLYHHKIIIFASLQTKKIRPCFIVSISYAYLLPLKRASLAQPLIHQISTIVNLNLGHDCTWQKQTKNKEFHYMNNKNIQLKFRPG